MPGIDDIGSSWADQVEQGDEHELPPPHEDFDDAKGIKTIIEYKTNEDGKKVRVVKTYRVEIRKVCKSIARRKGYKKFGDAAPDPPGPNSTNTVIGEDVYMQFVHTKDAQNTAEEDKSDPLSRLKGQSKLVSCRYCKGDHWSKECPHKDKLEALQEMKKKGEQGDLAAAAGPAPPQPGSGKSVGGKYIPPSLREGAAKRGPGESMANSRGVRDESSTIRVTNLSEDTREADLQELFEPFGNIQRIFLAKDKVTGQSKGFAFINFYNRKDAQDAIAGVSGFGYDHLILNVEWAKPSTT